MSHRFVVAVLALYATAGPVPGEQGTTRPEAPVVPVARPVERQVNDVADFTGRTQAVETVEIRARVTGFLTRVNFEDGAEVKKGDVLFEIDPRPYQAQVDRAAAKLAQAKARGKHARDDHARATRLLNQRAISKEDYDKTADDVSYAEAIEKVQESDLEVARLNLAWTRVQAPLSGHIGRRLLDVGNIVVADKSPLAVILSEDPLYVYFDLDQATWLRLLRAQDAGRLKPPQGGKLPVSLGLAGEEGYPHRGTVDFVNNQVNSATGALTMRAVVANPQTPRGVRLLAPGMFARVRLALGPPYRALLVTDRAVLSDQGVKFVYVLDKDNKVQYRRVTAGQLQPDGLRVIAEGLKTGDWVVLGGLPRLRPGMAVRPLRVPMPTLAAPGAGAAEPGKAGR